MTDRKGAHFERLVAAVLIMLDGRSTVQHDIKLPGLKSGELRQIDVCVTGAEAEVTSRLIVECKDHTRRVEIGRVDAFSGFLDDVGAVGGVLVTTVGYSQAALARAEASGIETWILRPARDEDWEGYLRRLSLRIVSRPTGLQRM